MMTNFLTIRHILIMKLDNKNMKNTKQLITKAKKLYKQNAYIEEWMTQFEPLELAWLWHNTCQITKDNPFGAEFDDEVYACLDKLNYFQ